MTLRSSTSSSDPSIGLGYLARRLLLFLPIAVLVTGINARIDPGNVLGTGERERQLANELLSGRSIETTRAHDELLLQKRYAEGLTRAPDVLVLGSSRSMPIASSAFPGLTLWNGSVSSASLDNCISVLQLFDELGLRPRVVLLGLDPWMLSAPLSNPSTALDSEADRARQRIGLVYTTERGALPASRSRGLRFLELLSPSYFQASVSVLAAGGWPALMAPRDGADALRLQQQPVGNTVRPDGSVEWGPLLVDRDEEAVRLMARLYAVRPPFYLLASRLLPERRQLLDAFVSHLQHEGVDVLFWLPPIHPDAYRSLARQEQTAAMVASEECYRDLARARNVPLIGSFDPVRAGAVAGDFVDQHHPRQEATRRMLRAGLPEGVVPAGRF